MASATGEVTEDPDRSAVGEASPTSGFTAWPRRRLSICLYTPSADPSGMGAHMLDLAAEFRSQADVSVLCWGTPSGRRVLERAAALGVATCALPPPRDPAFAHAIVEFLTAHPADVFHIHVGSGRENFDGARAARRAGVPAVVQTQHQPWLLNPRKKAAFFRAIAPVDRLIAVSEGVRLTHERIGVPAERLVTVPNGIVPRGRGPGRLAARAALGLEPDHLVVMNVGRLMVQKGQCYLVAAMPDLAARFARLAVVIVGGGYLADDLARQAADLGVAACLHLPGHRTDARMLLDAADVFALPSRQEGMPLAALEAMDAGLPVVATDVIGTAEVVISGVTGTLVSPEDPPALAEAVAELLADPDLRQRYARAGRHRYVAHFTARRMAEDTLRVYEDVLAGAAPPVHGSVPSGRAVR
ncbi:glycosyltransferase family 4 protein [Blastococcus mobilis]|uniref:Glycosyltransferase involved in cell wall bisynthesis n=1 Tax=Blastococcus mobilis TaxID=1938746 RepID=A0A238XMB4_9ACTN|nr:glycosyltransferase family 4 protein [Blastococcus mobilis]SNR60105.1 Glycosyltransferase involved in cell wall bisynthesis [Blastococcus mobilis]